MLKARDNPFATDRLERKLKFVPEWSGLSWERIEKKLDCYHWRCAIAGAHGSGKTTLLDALEVRLRERGSHTVRLFFNDDGRPQLAVIMALRKSVGPETVLLCDGAEQLKAVQWLALRSVAARARGMIVTCHQRARLPVAIRLEVTLELVEKLLCNTEPATDWSGKVAELIQMHNGNVREIFRTCYYAAGESSIV